MPCKGSGLRGPQGYLTPLLFTAVYGHHRPGRVPLEAYGVWLGLSSEDTDRQIAEALEFIDGRSPATFGGDFNAQPDSNVVAAVKAAGFIDPFEALGQTPAPPTDPATDPVMRVDYVWLRGMAPRRAWVSESLASDHLMVVVEVEPLVEDGGVALGDAISAGR